jgi:hypothetical protein
LCNRNALTKSPIAASTRYANRAILSIQHSTSIINTLVELGRLSELVEVFIEIAGDSVA